MTAIHAGPIGPDGLGGAFPNETETDRTAWWYGMGGKQGVLRGLGAVQVPGQMALDIDPGAALLGERDGGGGLLQRGYLAWTDAVTRVTFGAASASDRVDALVIAAADTEEGAAGTGGLVNGGHLVVVPGVSGTSTPRTDTDIRTWVGRGGWLRLADVPVASTDTQINTAGMGWTALKLNDWNVLSYTKPANWTGFSGRYMVRGTEVTIEISGTYTGATLTATSEGNLADTTIGTNLPTELRPSVNDVYDRFVRNGLNLGSWRISSSGTMQITDAYPTSTIANPSNITFRAKYDIGQG